MRARSSGTTVGVKLIMIGLRGEDDDDDDEEEEEGAEEEDDDEEGPSRLESPDDIIAGADAGAGAGFGVRGADVSSGARGTFEVILVRHQAIRITAEEGKTASEGEGSG